MSDPINRLSYQQIRAARDLSDNRLPEDIEGVLGALTQEELQVLFLSRLREMLFGSDPSKHWYTDFRSLGISSLKDLSLDPGHNSRGICLASDNVGDVVCINGETVDGILQVTRADISNPLKVPAIGVITSKSSLILCTVTRYGVIQASLTSPQGLCFVGEDGRPTITRPSPSAGGSLFIQVLGAALGTNQVLLNPSFNLTRVKST
jgi:hypothetical protein